MAPPPTRRGRAAEGLSLSSLSATRSGDRPGHSRLGPGPARPLRGRGRESVRGRAGRQSPPGLPAQLAQDSLQLTAASPRALR